MAAVSGRVSTLVLEPFEGGHDVICSQYYGHGILFRDFITGPAKSLYKIHVLVLTVAHVAEASEWALKHGISKIPPSIPNPSQKKAQISLN